MAGEKSEKQKSDKKNINKNIEKLVKNSESAKKKKNSDIDNDFFSERSFVCESNFFKDKEGKPKFHSKRYHSRKDPYDSSEHESSDEELPENVETTGFFNPINPISPVNPTAFAPPLSPYPVNLPYNQGWHPHHAYHGPHGYHDESSDTDEQHERNEKKEKKEGKEKKENHNNREKDKKAQKTQTDSKKNVKKYPKSSGKYHKDPNKHLDKALYYYYNQNPPFFNSPFNNGFNPYGFNRPWRYEKNNFDHCPSSYYDVYKKIAKQRPLFPSPWNNSYNGYDGSQKKHKRDNNFPYFSPHHPFNVPAMNSMKYPKTDRKSEKSERKEKKEKK